MRTKDEIEEFMSKIDVNAPSKYPGMSYESGLEEALRWVLGEADADEIFE